MNTRSYLTFLLSNKEFAVNVEQINNIIELTKLNKVNGAPSFMKGVMAHEDKLLPVVDLRMKMGMPQITYTMHTCILLAEIQIMGRKTQVGLLVDAVQSVLEIASQNVFPISDKRVSSFRPFIVGKTNYEGQQIKLMELNKLFAKWEIENMSELQEAGEMAMKASLAN